MMKAQFQLEPLTCPSCIKYIETSLSKVAGVTEVKVLFSSSKVKLSFDQAEITAEQLEETMEKLGYPVLSSKIA